MRKENATCEEMVNRSAGSSLHSCYQLVVDLRRSETLNKFVVVDASCRLGLHCPRIHHILFFQTGLVDAHLLIIIHFIVHVLPRPAARHCHQTHCYHHHRSHSHNHNHNKYEPQSVLIYKVACLSVCLSVCFSVTDKFSSITVYPIRDMYSEST